MAVAALGWSAVGNLVLGERAYLPRNVALSLFVLAAAPRLGVSLGLRGRDLTRGSRWGLGAAAAVAAAVGTGVLLQDRVGWVGALLADDRAAEARGSLAYHTLLRIPVGTALFEELVFRGLLLGLLLRAGGPRAAVAWSSVVFGLWHVAPTAVALRLNDVAPTGATGLATIAGAVVVTAVAGAGFAWLRLRSGSLLAPVIAHWATNALGLLAAARPT